MSGKKIPNPQLEHGFTRIANELLEAFLRVELSGQEFRTLLTIVRKTYGFNKKTDRISNSQIAAFTGLTKTRASQITNQLVKKKVINDEGTGFNNIKIYSINKNYLEWKGYQKNDSPDSKGYRNNDGKGSQNTDTTKDKEQKTEYNSKQIPIQYLRLSLEFHQERKSSGYYHKDFKSELTFESDIVLNGAKTIAKLVEEDDETLIEVKEVLDFIYSDLFWDDKIISLNTIRRIMGNGNTKYFMIKNDMKRKIGEKIYSMDDLANLGIEPRHLDGNFINVGIDKYKPNRSGQELIDKKQVKKWQKEYIENDQVNIN